MSSEAQRGKSAGTFSDKGSVDQSENAAEKNIGMVMEEAPAPATSWAGTAEEKRLVRKLDMRIMPLTCLLYLFACELCVLFDGIFIQYPDTPYLSPYPRTWQ